MRPVSSMSFDGEIKDLLLHPFYLEYYKYKFHTKNLKPSRKYTIYQIYMANF